MKKFICILLTSLCSLSAETLIGEVIQLTKSNVESVCQSSDYVIIDAYGPNCFFCKCFLPLFREMHREFGSLYQFASLNVKDEPALIDHFQLKTIPTIIFIKNGVEVGRHAGSMNRDKFKSEIKQHFEKHDQDPAEPLDE